MLRVVKKVLLIGICILICGVWACRVSSEPHIEFTRVPFPDPGGTTKLDVIEGRVIGAQAGQRIVLYARSGDWYVQPFIEQPVTDIQPDSTWSNSTHLGTEYAALLVDQNFIPPSVAAALPSRTDGVRAIAISKGSPFFWQTWWFQSLGVLAVLVALFALYRIRMRQMAHQANILFEERLAERTRIAQELHDTLLQGFLSASFQLHVAVEQLPDDTPGKGKLVQVQQLMGKVIEEGRNAVLGLRSNTSIAIDPGSEFSHLAEELNNGNQVDFRVIIEGMAEPLQPLIWDESYNICREALINAFRHANANAIELEIEYSAKHLRILVRDDGRGIEPAILESGREGHWGLSGMRERADKIGASLKVMSRRGAGTEVELFVPNHIAFEIQQSPKPLSWLTGLYSRRMKNYSQNQQSKNETER